MSRDETTRGGGERDDGPSLEELLAERCPTMRPTKGAPSMFTLNGCGFMLYGARDHDSVTRTYVKTLFFTLVFVPILAIGSYRVADSPNGGWYFLGKEPLGALAKNWTFLVLATVLALGGWSAYASHIESPEYRAGVTLAEAQQLEAEGEPVEAAERYAGLARSPKRGEARKALLALLDAERPDDLPTRGALLGVVLGSPFASAVEGDRARTLIEVARLATPSDPRGALALLDALRPVAPDAVNEVREPALAGALAQDPQDAAIASELALIYEGREDWDRCEAVLTPCAERLTDQEGARILGQLLSSRGETERAHALLEPYATKRLAALHKAEERLDQAYAAAWDAAIEALKRGEAGERWYTRYDRSSEEQQAELVNAWVRKRNEGDPALRKLQDALVAAAAVVPVALDLGIVKLQRAQALSDPAARKAELERAEQVFLAIQGVAGDSAAYKLNLGTVYYWLGKEAEGHTLFDELLAETERAPMVLLRVARELRGVGATAEAIALSEEAYEAADDADAKRGAASLRAVLADDPKDEVLWLERAGSSDPFSRAQLAAAKGGLAWTKGNEDVAERHFRSAITAYGDLPRSAGTLNNTGLIYQRLFGLRGDTKDFVRAVELLVQAEQRQSSDSILVGNVAGALLGRASLETIGDRLDFAALRSGPSASQLAFLHRTAAERERAHRELTGHADFAAAVERLQKLRVLAPKGSGSYQQLLSALYFTYSREEHQALEAALSAAELDLEEYGASVREWRAGTDREEELQNFQRAVARSEDRLARVRQAGHPASLALALCEHAALLLAAEDHEQPLDVDRSVALAEEACGLAKSRGATEILTLVLLARATVRLSAANETFATMRKAARRTVNIATLPLLALHHAQGALREAAREDPDVRRAAQLMAELGRADPQATGAWDWVLLAGVLPETAAVAAKAIQADPVAPIRLRARVALEPLSADAALALAFYHRATGDEAQAEAVLTAARERGVSFP